MPVDALYKSTYTLLCSTLLGYGISDYATSPYAAIGNGRVHYSTTSALPPTLLSASRRQHDAGAYTSDALPAFYDRRDLLSTTCDRRSVAPTSPDDYHSAPEELPRSRLKFIRIIGHGLFGDVRKQDLCGKSSQATDLFYFIYLFINQSISKNTVYKITQFKKIK